MDHDPTVAAVVDYCQTQARLLSGQAETLSAEIDAVLDEIDAEATALRERLDGATKHAESPEQPTNPGTPAVDEDAIEQLEARQSAVAQKQDRLDEIRDLSAGYADLADTLQTDDIDVTEAITEVLEFEAEHDAQAFFDERETLLETTADR